MQEVTFLKNNIDKWKRIEKLLIGRVKIDPDVLAELFIQLTDDLSYTRTFYPNSKTTNYLNSLTARVHQTIYKNKKEKSNRFITFWQIEVPGIIKEHYRELFSAFSIFLIAILIGIISSANDNEFVRIILGDSYVNMTLENIEKGDPLAVYKKMNAFDMFLGITFNNISVALYAFVAGAIFSFGTGFILLRNGVMLGVFQYFFFQHGLLYKSILTIWIHGTLEISAIIVAGCAGIVMGNSILFPKTYARKQSFVIGAKKGLKIVTSLIPIFIVAGFLEGFVTRHTDMPEFLSLTIIFVSLAFIIWYFFIYPFRTNVTFKKL